MILGAETILVWARASPAESRRSSCPVVPRNLPMRRPTVVPGMLTPVPEAGKFTRKSFGFVAKGGPLAPRVKAIGERPPPELVLIELSPHRIPSPRGKALV